MHKRDMRNSNNRWSSA